MELSRPLVMGVLNVTPDSFYEKSRERDPEMVVERAGQMLQDGASILDIGGYSSRPGAEDVPEEVEMERVLPPVRAILEEFPEAVVSVDTFRYTVAKEAIRAGAGMINDITAGTHDPGIFELVAEARIPYVLMHMQGMPQTMQRSPTYEDVVPDVSGFLEDRINCARQKGVRDPILDPGFGFGKTLDHNYRLLNGLEAFTRFGVPLLVGISRKSMINKVLNIKPEEALPGTMVMNTLALLKGARILRVHDVKEACQAIELVERYSLHKSEAVLGGPGC